MVENHIHHHLETFLMTSVNQRAILVVGAETWVNAIVVGAGVAVISGPLAIVGRVVLEDRSEPQGCDSQFVEVVQMLANALQVASVTQRGLRAVVHVGVHTGNLIVVATTRGKAVGHQQIEHIADIKALALLAHLLTSLQLKGLRFEF